MPRPPVRLVRDRPTWLIYGQLSLWAYFVYAFTPVVPLLRVEQHTSRMVASLHGTAFAVGGVLGGLLLPAISRRLGRHARIWSGMAGASVAILGLTVARPLPATLALVAVASFCGSVAVNAMSAALAAHHGPAGAAAISEANAAAAGIGAAAPLLIGASVGIGWGWRPGLIVMLFGLAALAVVATALRIRVPGERTSAADGAAARLPRRFWLPFVSIVATASVEVCMNQWGADVLRQRVGLAQGAATAAVAAIIGGMFLGRLVGGRLALRFPSARILLASLGLSAVGFAAFWLATWPPLAVVGLAVCGLGNGVHFPLGIALAIEHSGGQPDLATSKTAFAIGIAFGVSPFALGTLADRVGPHTAFAMVPLFLALSALVIAPLARGSDAGGEADARLDARPTPGWRPRLPAPVISAPSARAR
jgi:MFS family permease